MFKSFHVSPVSIAMKFGCLAALLAGASVARAETNAWLQLAPQGMGFRVAMPGEPAHQTMRHTTDSGEEVLQHLFIHEDTARDCGMLVSVIDAPAEAVRHRNLNPTTTINKMRDGFVNSVNGTISREVNLTIAGHPGREVEFHGQRGDVSYTATWRGIIVGDRVFMVAMFGNVETFSAADLERFLSSFQLQ